MPVVSVSTNSAALSTMLPKRRSAGRSRGVCT